MTTKASSTKVNPKKSKISKALYQEYKHLQDEWETLKHSNPHPSRSTTSTIEPNTIIDKALQKILLKADYTPRTLVSSLQHQHSFDGSPPHSELSFKMRFKSNRVDTAVEEILRERRDAFAGGKFKGRRLFEASDRESFKDGASREGDENCSECINEALLRENDHDEEKNSDKEGLVRWRNGGGKRSLEMAWFGILLMVFMVGIISMRSCGSTYEEEITTIILVPT